MHCAAFSCAIITKHWGKQLLAWWLQTNCGSDPNKLIWTQSSGGRGRGGANELGFGPGKRTKCESTLSHRQFQSVSQCSLTGFEQGRNHHRHWVPRNIWNSCTDLLSSIHYTALLLGWRKSFKSNIFSLLCLSGLTVLVNIKIIELANQIKVGGV